MPWCTYCGNKLHDNTDYCTVCHRLLEKAEKSPLPPWLTGEKIRRRIEEWAVTTGTGTSGKAGTDTDSGIGTTSETAPRPQTRGATDAAGGDARPGGLFGDLKKAFEEAQAGREPSPESGPPTAVTATGRPAADASARSRTEAADRSRSRGLARAVILVLFATFVIGWQILAPEEGEGSGGALYFVALILFWVMSSLFSKRSEETPEESGAESEADGAEEYPAAAGTDRESTW